MFKTLPHLGSGSREFVKLLASEAQIGLEWVDVYRNRSGVAGSDFASGEQLTLADRALARRAEIIELLPR